MQAIRNSMDRQLLQKAINGDTKAFHTLYAEFEPQLKSYLYRLLLDKNDINDLVQDTFARAIDKLASYQEKSSLKTWVFKIATRLAYDRLRDKARWSVTVLDKCKDFAHGNESLLANLKHTSAYSRYDIMEHIDCCFTCMSKTLPLEQQLVLMLKDVYEFKVKEIASIINKSVPAVKHILRFGRQSMIRIFDNRCSLINKKGACHQCSELNGWLNPAQKKQEDVARKALNAENRVNNEHLLKLREALVRSIDPLNMEGADLQDVFIQIGRKVEGEIEKMSYEREN